MSGGSAPAPGAITTQRSMNSGTGHSTSLGDILERVLDKGLVIAGDIQVNLLDIELLTIKLRLVIASLDTAREVGINWWENDPWLSAEAGRLAVNGERGQGKQVRGSTVRGELDDGDDARELRKEIRRLRGRISELESGKLELDELEPDERERGRRESRQQEPRRRESRRRE